MLNLCLVCPKTKSGILPYFDIKNQVLALFDSASMTSKNYTSHSIIIRRNVHWAQLQQMVMSVPGPGRWPGRCRASGRNTNIVYIMYRCGLRRVFAIPVFVLIVFAFVFLCLCIPLLAPPRGRDFVLCHLYAYVLQHVRGGTLGLAFLAAASLTVLRRPSGKQPLRWGVILPCNERNFQPQFQLLMSTIVSTVDFFTERRLWKCKALFGSSEKTPIE